MKPLSFSIGATVVLLAPLVLVLIVLRPPIELWQRVLEIWLWEIAPQLLVVIVGAMYAPARRSAWVPLLLLASLTLDVQAVEFHWTRNAVLFLIGAFYYPLVLTVISLWALFVWITKDQGVQNSGTA